MTLPEPVVALLSARVVIGEAAQAFPFLTVDGEGLPHVALLSAVELAAGDDGSSVHAAMASPTTRMNLHRSGAATLVAVEGSTAHSVKLRLRRSLDAEGLLGAVLDVVSHKADSVGVALSPISYVATEELATLERWDRTARVLALLASG